MKTESVQYSGAYAAMGIDNSRGVEGFCNDFKVEIVKLTEDMIEFDMVGIDASLANAFRRILIAEVSCLYETAVVHLLVYLSAYFSA